MSRPFRQRFLNELRQKRTSKYEKAVAKFFDNGFLRIERSKWDIVYINAFISSQAAMVAQKVIKTAAAPPKGLPDSVWKDLFIHLQGNGGNPKLQRKGTASRGELVRFHTNAFSYSNTMIKLPYTRGKGEKTTSAPLGVPYTGNLERRAEQDLRNFMKKFVNSPKFVKPAVQSITSRSDQEYEHGATGEQNFLDGASTSINVYDASGKGDGGIIGAKGAQGVVTDQRIANFLIEELEGAYAREDWFDNVFEAVYAKWQDMFGYDTVLDQNDREDSVKSSVTFKGALVPILSKINVGTIDRALLNDMKRFLQSREFFVAETTRLNKEISIDSADKMFSDSPPPSKRMEEAAIKLATANMLETIQNKNIRNRKKVGKPKRSVKTGSKTTAKRRGPTRKVTTKRATVRKKRGRPTKQAQAFGGNVLALKELINKMLPDVVLQKMQSPALVNRTGRFRRSAEVTNAMIGPRGGVQIDYTYQRDPYGVFEPGSGSPLANQYRDPRAIIGGSVREIAQSIMGKKFVKVRRV